MRKLVLTYKLAAGFPDCYITRDYNEWDLSKLFEDLAKTAVASGVIKETDLLEQVAHEEEEFYMLFKADPAEAFKILERLGLFEIFHAESVKQISNEFFLPMLQDLELDVVPYWVPEKFNVKFKEVSDTATTSILLS